MMLCGGLKAQRTLEEQLQFFSVYGLPVVDGVKKGNEEETLQVSIDR